jgi:hypothetical protein
MYSYEWIFLIDPKTSKQKTNFTPYVEKLASNSLLPPTSPRIETPMTPPFSPRTAIAEKQNSAVRVPFITIRSFSEMEETVQNLAGFVDAIMKKWFEHVQMSSTVPFSATAQAPPETVNAINHIIEGDFIEYGQAVLIEYEQFQHSRDYAVLT